MKQRSRPTISDVARVAGVAPMTVSRVLTGSARVKDETAERVQNAVRLLRYEPNEIAREFRRRQVNSFGLILPRLTDPATMACAGAIYDAAEAKGQTIALFASNGDAKKERALISRAAKLGLPGVILIPGDDRSLVTPADVEDIQVVALYRPLAGATVNAVLAQDRQGARLAVKHLMSHHLSKIIFLSSSEPQSTNRERLEGYRDAVEFAGLGAYEYVWKTETEISSLLLQHVKSNPSEEVGIVCSSVESTLALLRIMPALPESARKLVGFIGLDDFPAADVVVPAVTTVRQPLAEMSVMAVELLLRKMEDNPAHAEATSISVPVELIVRVSCGCQPSRPR